MPRDDAELLAGAGRGDSSAFATLYRKYETDLYRFVFYLAGGPETAEELFQETWLRVARYRGKKPVLDFKKWIFTIATNLYRDELRKRKVRRLVLGRVSIEDDFVETGDENQPVVVPAIEPDAERFAVREALKEAMKKLTGRQRTIFTLMYVEGFKIREVCDMLGKAEGTVKSTLHRALVILRDELKDIR